jgi:hypothetical protein
MSNTKTWLGFWLLALIWGSSYLFKGGNYESTTV